MKLQSINLMEKLSTIHVELLELSINDPNSKIDQITGSVEKQ